MKTIIVSKADGIIDGEPIESIALEISGPLEHFEGLNLEEHLKAHRDYYQIQAKTIADILFKHLPGGTIDQLLCEMLQKRAVLLRVPF